MTVVKKKKGNFNLPQKYCVQTFHDHNYMIPVSAQTKHKCNTINKRQDNLFTLFVLQYLLMQK